MARRPEAQLEGCAAAVAVTDDTRGVRWFLGGPRAREEAGVAHVGAGIFNRWWTTFAQEVREPLLTKTVTGQDLPCRSTSPARRRDREDPPPCAARGLAPGVLIRRREGRPLERGRSANSRRVRRANQENP